jgi:TonB family protein
MLFSALALLAAAEPVPAGEISRIFTAEDYPIEALMNGDKGTVSVEAAVNPDGRVTGCRITRSSGSSRLDSTTCTIIIRRGHFADRARRHGGKPFTITTSVTWDSKPMGIPLVANVLRIIYTTNPAATCRTETPDWMSMHDACDRSRANAAAAIADLAKERSLDGLEYVIEMASIPGDHLADNRAGEGRGEMLLGRQTALLTLAADGRVSACVGGEDTLAGELSAWCESFVKNEVYEPLPGSAGNQSERRLTRIQAIYLRPAAPR